MVRRACLCLPGSLILTLAAAAPAGAADCKDQDLLPSNTNAVQIRGALRCLINDEPRTRGKTTLTANVGVVRGVPARDGGPGATYCVEFGRKYKH
jgi:hypothetical protein